MIDAPPQELHLSVLQKRMLHAVANQEAPHEAVAVLVGPPDAYSDAWQIAWLRNEAPWRDRARRCEVTSEQLRPHMEGWAEIGWTIHAWWHSHPASAAVPSDIDHGNDDVPLCLITTAGELRYESQRTRAWWMQPGERAIEIPLTVTG